MSEGQEQASAQFLIDNQLGLHVRAAAMLVGEAAKFEADIRVSTASASADAHSLLDLLTLAATKGTKVTVTATGKDAAQALAAIGAVIDRKFSES